MFSEVGVEDGSADGPVAAGRFVPHSHFDIGSGSDEAFQSPADVVDVSMFALEHGLDQRGGEVAGTFGA
jgi:hypothetical protein